MAQISDTIIKNLASRFKKERDVSREHKRKRIRHWQKNEDMYYMKKVISDETRSNVDAGLMQGYVHTFLSKIDNKLTFKFKYRKEADLKSVEKVNALKEQDANDDDWDLKDLAGKKQVTLYGRAIFMYYADAINGIYKPHLEPVDVYDFLIDPRVGGIDIENARYMGCFNVVLDEEDIRIGMKEGIYRSSVAKRLLRDGGGSTSPVGMEEDTNKRNRETYEGGTAKHDQETADPDDQVYYFWQWFTTYKGVRYYLLITDDGEVLRAEKLTDMVLESKKFPRGAWPIWTYAAYPDLTEFWTPSPADVVRDIFEAQGLSVNQMIDLAELIVDPMKVINTDKVKNKAALKTAPGGVIEVTPGETARVEDIIQFVKFAEITTPKVVYDVLGAIAEAQSGVTSGMRGLSEEDKVAIYEGNQAEAADRLSLVNKSYSKGYKRMAYLWLYGVQKYLKKPVAIDMIGPNGVQMSEVTRKDIRGYAEFVPIVESTDSDVRKDAMEKRTKFSFLTSLRNDPKYNQSKITELMGTIVGFTEEDIKELLDPDKYGNAQLMSEAARDIEEILKGNLPTPNLNANMAYMQKIIDWVKDNTEYMLKNPEKIALFDQYIMSIDPIVTQNTARSLNNNVSEQMINGAMGATVTPPTAEEQQLPINEEPTAEPLI